MHSESSLRPRDLMLDALVAGQLADELLPSLPPVEEYRLVRRLGQGGMGCVYLAHDTLLDRPVALKFLFGLAQSPAARQRFLIEARAIARLQHPNVVSLYRIGEITGHPFLVSEYVRGQSLDRLPRPLPASQVAAIGIELARGLSAAHRRGVLHRDLKPANALLTEEGTVKLLDFGLAKLVGPLAAPGHSLPGIAPVRPAFAGVARALRGEPHPDEPIELATTRQSDGDLAGPSLPPSPVALTDRPRIGDSTPELTQAGSVMGTPLYMAPEMWRGEPATPQVDVYSLGALLYELASGRPPHYETNVEALRQSVLQPPRPLLSAVADFHAPLAEVIDRCLSLDPTARYASAEELCQALEASEPGARPERPRALPVEISSNPYRGLRAFDREDSALFFGRRTEAAEVLDRLGADPIVLVAGDSGVGKSSLCRAGVLARIADGSWQWAQQRRYAVASLFPGRHPAVALADVLAPILECSPESLRHELLNAPQDFARRLQLYPGSGSGGVERGLILFIDQLEELVTQSARAEATCVSEALGQLTARVSGLRVLSTARGDFLTRLAALPGLGREIGRALYILRPLGREGLREAIVGPAEASGVRFESTALVSELVDATLREDGGLPLLQFTLAELWEARDPEAHLITAAALRRKGGVTGALWRHADRALAELMPTERSATKRLLLRLVTVDGMRARRSRHELLGEAGADPAEVSALEALVRSRLLVAREADGDTVYELAHEALVSGWQTLKEWLGSEADRRAVRERLRAAAAEWARILDEAEAPLWGERQLNELADVGLGDESPSELEAQFLTASRHRLRRQRWVGRLLGGGVLLSLLGIFVLGRRTLDQEQHAEAEALTRERAQHIELGAFASSLAEQPGREAAALVSALQATAPHLRAHELPEPQALSGLAAAVKSAQQSLPLRGHKGPVGSVALSPSGPADQQTVLTAGWDGTLRLWSAETGAPLRTVQAHAKAPCAAQYSPDGKLIATISGDRSVALWDAGTLGLLHRMPLDAAPLGHYLSPDGSRLLALLQGSEHPETPQVWLWDTVTGRRLASWSGVSTMTPPGPFSPDGSRLLTGEADGAVHIYDTSTGEPRMTLRLPKEYPSTELLRPSFSPDGQQVIAVAARAPDKIFAWEVKDKDGRFRVIKAAAEIAAFAWHPDGTTLATADADYAVRLWDLDKGVPKLTLPTQYSLIKRLAFSPDGVTLATSGTESGIRLWDSRTGFAFETLRGHADLTQAVSFGRSGTRLVSASTDGTARLWNLQDSQHLLRLVSPGHEVTAATYSADGRYVGTAGRDGTARVWDATTGQLLATMTMPAAVSSVAFSPDSTTLAAATSGQDRAIWLWSWPEQRNVATLRGHELGVLWVSFSPDGERVASASQDTTVRVWRWRSGEQLWRSQIGLTGALVLKVEFSPDGSQLASADSLGHLRLWDAASGGLQLASTNNNARPSTVAYSPLGKLVAVGGSNPTLLETELGRIRLELAGHKEPVTAISFSRDGRRIATVSNDRSARVFDAASGQLTHILHVGSASSIEFSPDGQRLLIAQPGDRGARIYPATSQALLETACLLLRYQPEWTHVEALCSN